MNRLQHILNIIKEYLSKMDLKVYLICVLIATFIWLMMKLSEGYSNEIEIPIHYSGFPEGMILVNKPTASLKVQVESQGFQMMTIALRNNRRVQVNLSNLELRPTKYKRWVASIPSHLFSYEISSQLGVDPIGSNVKPDSIYFVFDSLITKEVAVKLNTRLSFSEGNTIYQDITIDPPKVQVSGPALAINTLKFIYADSLILEHIDKDFKKKLKLSTTNKLVKLNPASVDVTAKVTKFSEFSSIVPLLVHTNIPNLKIRTFPSKVKITYSIPIPEYDNISDSSFVVAVVVDSMDVLKNNHLIPKIIQQPKFVKSSSLNIDKVEFIILKQ